MKMQHKLFKILYSPHISEKSTIVSKKNNIIVLRVSLKSNKNDIKLAFENLFSKTVKSITTVVMKGKLKKAGNHYSYRSNWKKAYIRLHKDQSIDFMK